ncbi:MAG: hypothetical protein R3B70_28180, partial [Polyangiaceae bacterium]
MRCPKCATSFVVTKPGSPGAKAAAPKPTAPAAPRPAAPKPAPRPAAPPPADDAGDEWDLPAPTADRGARGAPPPARRPVAAAPPPVEDVEEDIDLPIVASGPSAPRPGAFVPGRPPGVGLPSAGGAAAARAPAPSPSGGGKSGAFGEIDLLVDLPVPEGEDPDDAEIDLPVARDARPAFARTGAAVPPGPPAKGARPAASPDAVRARTQLFGDTVPEPAEVAPVGKAAPIRVPVPARDSRPGAKGGAKGAGAARAAAAAPPPPPPSDEGLGFGEIDLPLLASEADLPAAAAGLPTPMDGAGLPARQQPGLPVATPGSSLPVATDGTSLPLRGRVPTPIGDPRASSPGFDRASSPGFERASSSSFDRASSPGFDRASSVGFDRASSPGFERKSSADLGRDAGPNIHGPGHIAGADIYSGALYDDRHMDPAFRAEARSVVTKLPTEDDADEAPLMTTSGAPVAPAPGPTVGRATMPDPGARAAFASEPRIGAIAAEERLSRGAAGASMADLIDRTSIELDLIEPTAPPAAPVGPLPPIDRSAKTMPAVPQGTPAPFGVEESIGADPMSVPDLSSTPAPVIPVQRFGVDPFADPSSDPFSGGSAEVGDEAPLAPPDVGDEADLGAKGPTIRTPSVGKLPPMPEAPASTDSPVAGRPWKKYVLVLAIAGLLTGAGLTLVPDIGPFGLNFVSDRVNKKLHDDALDTARNIIHDDLEADTSAGADSAIGKVKTAQHAYPRHRATAGYAAYVAYLRILRFGPRAEDKAFGDMMIRVSQDRQSDFLLLGQAAQDAVVGQIARARQTMQGLLERRPDDIDVAVLAGEIELLAKSGDQATRVWQKAVEIKKIPRTLFGLARAQFAGGDLIGAEASARNTLSLSPKHVGARILLADVVWQSSAREAQALELLGKVTEDGEIRKSAGDPELVAAYTLLGHIHLAKSRMTQAEAAFAAALKLDPQAVNA